MRRILFACAVIMTAKTVNAIKLEADSMLEVAAFAQPDSQKVIAMAAREVDRINNALSDLEEIRKGNSHEAKDLRQDLEEAE